MLNQIIKGGARFDVDKARWFNQQYLIKSDVNELLSYIGKYFPAIVSLADQEYLLKVIPLFQERIHLITELPQQAGCFFTEYPDYDEKQVRKRYKSENHELYKELFEEIKSVGPFERDLLKSSVEKFVATKGTKYGVVLPVLRLAVAGVLQGPDLFAMMEVIGKIRVSERLDKALEYFPSIK